MGPTSAASARVRHFDTEGTCEHAYLVQALAAPSGTPVAPIAGPGMGEGVKTIARSSLG
jgi:hypothetical protein